MECWSSELLCQLGKKKAMKWSDLTSLGRGHQKEKLEQLSSVASTRIWVAFVHIAKSEYIKVFPEREFTVRVGLKEAICPVSFSFCVSDLC